MRRSDHNIIMSICVSAEYLTLPPGHLNGVLWYEVAYLLTVNSRRQRYADVQFVWCLSRDMQCNVGRVEALLVQHKALSKALSSSLPSACTPGRYPQLPWRIFKGKF